MHRKYARILIINLRNEQRMIVFQNSKMAFSLSLGIQFLSSQPGLSLGLLLQALRKDIHRLNSVPGSLTITDKALAKVGSTAN